MLAYVITSAHESSRKEQVERLMKDCQFPIQKVDAIYPSLQHVPFTARLLEASRLRVGKALLHGELGCLLSHRKVWRDIVSRDPNPKEHFLVFESDSMIMDAYVLNNSFQKLTQSCDLFFWGAWEGHLKFFRSTIRKEGAKHRTGEPFIKTAYCTYGYSLNRKAAQLLLKRTARISHPVDQFKYFFTQDELKLGGILPEVVTGNQITSTIRGNDNGWKKRLLLFVLDIKNNFICAFR